MCESFETYEEAEKDLAERKKLAYKRIEEEGGTIVSDGSFIGTSFLDGKSFQSFLMIWTQSMIDDITKFKGFDYDQYNEEIKKLEENEKTNKKSISKNEE